MKKKIAAFDFDGTLINGDSFIKFSLYACGKWRFLSAILRCIHILFLYKIKLYPNWKAKETLFSKMFKGRQLDKFNTLANEFFANEGHDIFNQSAVKCVQEHQGNGCRVIIVSASPKNWVVPFAEHLGIDTVLSTEVEIDDNGRLTGKFSNKNCYGGEKVLRLQKELGERESYYLYAYGDSRGDKEMLIFADEGYYRKFQ